MATYIELTPSTITLTDSITGSLKNIKLHDGHLWLETTTGTYVQLLDNYTQDTEANKSAAGTQGRWFYATDSTKLYYDNGTAWQEILNKTIYFLQDTEANKPAAGTQGRWFYATDTNNIYYDDGSNWNLLNFKTKETDIYTTCASVAITGLDFNTYKKIQVYGLIYNPSANNETISLCVNGDTTVTNYYCESAYANGTTISGNRFNDARCCEIDAGKCAFFNAIVGYDYNNVFRAITKHGRNDPTNIKLNTYVIAGSSNVTNITELDLVSDQSDSIGAGSKIYIKQG